MPGAAGKQVPLPYNSVWILRPEKLEFAKFLTNECGASIVLHLAAGLERLDLICEILDSDPDRVNERGPNGATPLHLAANIEIADFLLERGADDSPGSSGVPWLL